MSKTEQIDEIYNSLRMTDPFLQDEETAHLVVNHNRVLGAHTLPGLIVDAEEFDNGIRLNFELKEGVQIKKPVHLCFGMLPEEGLQEIILNVNIKEESGVSILAHCTFPNAVDVIHKMAAEIIIEEGASYTYREQHMHGPSGGVNVLPKALVTLKKGARFKTDFELLKGRVGGIEIDYESTCHEESLLEMNAKINGLGDDTISIRETGYLVGNGARGVLTSRIAVRDNARAEVYNKLVASAPYARGHVDCKEIIQGNGTATAIPIVEVRHPKAHVTHEAAIGSVDNKQLETLMARGLNEDDAVDLIIQGLLT